MGRCYLLAFVAACGRLGFDEKGGDLAGDDEIPIGSQLEPLVFDCRAGQSCVEPLVCPPGRACSFTCGDASCASGIDCTDAASCLIDCFGIASCAGFVACPDPTRCTIHCAGAGSC